jgi:hypothetical protein
MDKSEKDLKLLRKSINDKNGAGCAGAGAMGFVRLKRKRRY